jgi:hypothetical protein
MAGAQLRTLDDLRPTASPGELQAIDSQAIEIRRWRDAVISDLRPQAGSSSPPTLDVDIANLQRAMQGGAAAVQQAPLVPPIARPTGPTGSPGVWVPRYR